jgi:putative uroporphyrinogen-III C-methyltransferase
MKIKRAYAPVEDTDGYRILVDRLWPRGISKEKAKIDLWLKSVAPSNDLRKWFGHDPERFPEFSKRYQAELEESGALDELRAAIKEHPNATLLFAAHDEEHNNAVVLQHLLETK